jgi:hypothetical protein
MLRKKEMMSRISKGSFSNIIKPSIQQKIQWPPYIIYLDNKDFIVVYSLTQFDGS